MKASNPELYNAVLAEPFDVAPFDTRYESVEFAWETVDRVMNNGGKFRS